MTRRGHDRAESRLPEQLVVNFWTTVWDSLARRSRRGSLSGARGEQLFGGFQGDLILSAVTGAAGITSGGADRRRAHTRRAREGGANARRARARVAWAYAKTGPQLSMKRVPLRSAAAFENVEFGHLLDSS